MNEICYEERKKVYENAIEKYGNWQQVIVAIEEMSELQKEPCAWCKSCRSCEYYGDCMRDEKNPTECSDYESHFNFCPMCGRKLTEVQDG